MWCICQRLKIFEVIYFCFALSNKRFIIRAKNIQRWPGQMLHPLYVLVKILVIMVTFGFFASYIIWAHYGAYLEHGSYDESDVVVCESQRRENLDGPRRRRHHDAPTGGLLPRRERQRRPPQRRTSHNVLSRVGGGRRSDGGRAVNEAIMVAYTCAHNAILCLQWRAVCTKGNLIFVVIM